MDKQGDKMICEKCKKEKESLHLICGVRVCEECFQSEDFIAWIKGRERREAL